MLDSNHSSDNWGSANSRENFQPRTLHITKENKSVYLTVIWMLGITVFTSMIGMSGLSFLLHDIPQALIALGSVAVGALGSLFIHTK